MAVAITMPPVLCSPFPVSRMVLPLLSVNRFKPLSCKINGFDYSDEHYYSRKSLKYWDMFYKRHQNKFFKDRHYLEKDWGKYFSDSDDAGSADGKVLLEVGFGAGNTIFPLMAAYPMLFVHACDFSTEALNLVKVFMLSAVSPNKMPFVLQNLNKILKVVRISSCFFYPPSIHFLHARFMHVSFLQPNGHVLVRDYAVGDSAQVKLENRNQKISNNFYFRGDGTCSFYFSEDFLSNLFVEAGFCIVDLDTYCRQIENHSRNLTFDRRWVRAIFKKIDS